MAASSSRMLPSLQKKSVGDAKIFGVNYGNRFIPEEWMMCSSSAKPGDFFQGIEPGGKEPNGKSRVSLCDVTDSARMFQWLEDTIQEADFRSMRDMGVQVVRVPCGYWNWVSFPSDSVPDSTDKRLGNLQKLGAPSQYEPYFHRIFEYASKFGIQVLLDLHGTPGSQNGEMHSGASLPKSQFCEGWNCQKAVEAVSNMAAFAARKSNFFGLQVLNEPQDLSREFLESYYKRAILAARRHLPPEIPVIVFTWTYDMDHWRNNHFEQKYYGAVLWDTHVYHFPEAGETWSSPGGGLRKVKAAYEEDMELIRDFHRRQSGGCLVGEFSLAGPTLNAVQNCKLAKWLVEKFCDICHGCIFWNFDGPAISEWNMSKAAHAFGINWRALTNFIRLPAGREPVETCLAKLVRPETWRGLVEPCLAMYGHQLLGQQLHKSLPRVHLQQLVHRSLTSGPAMLLHAPLYRIT